MKLDLEALERKAKAATQGEWQWGRPADDDPDRIEHRRALFAPSRAASRLPVIVLDADSLTLTLNDDTEHIAAASPPVVLALIARIRELEAKLTEVRNNLRDGCLGQREIDALLEKGAVLP